MGQTRSALYLVSGPEATVAPPPPGGPWEACAQAAQVKEEGPPDVEGKCKPGKTCSDSKHCKPGCAVGEPYMVQETR